MPQALLTIELRRAIDLVRRRPYHPPTVQALRALLEANPRSASSTHVRYNLGRERARWLDQNGSRVGAGRPLVDTTDARSSFKEERDAAQP